MSGVSLRQRRGRVVLGTTLLGAELLGAVACFEPPLEPDSPFDPRSNYTVSLEDVPDSVLRWMGGFQMRATFDPAIRDGVRIEWTTSNVALISIGNGGYRAMMPTGAPQTVTVGAQVGTFRAERQVVLMARTDTLSVTCVDAGCDRLTSLGDQSRLTVRAVDGGGRLVPAFEYAIQTRGSAVSRTAGVLGVLGYNGSNYPVVAQGNGSSWVVFAADRGRDSIRITVEQVAVTWDIVCPTSIRVGETARLSVANPRDARDNALTIPAAAVEWTPGFETSVPSIGASATVTPDGSITADATGGWRTEAVVPSQGSRVIGVCDLYIDP
jgi:hypothetical protein